MALSLMDVLNPRGALRQREKEQQLAEQQAQNDAMAQAMGYGEQPTLSTISAMPALPARETSFQGDGSRFGMTGTDEDYQRLFGPAAQQQPSQLHQEVQRQQGGIPKDNSPRGKMIRNMVMSDNPTVRSNGLQLAQQQMLNPPQPAAQDNSTFTDAAGRRYWSRDGSPVRSDEQWQATRQEQMGMKNAGREPAAAPTYSDTWKPVKTEQGTMERNDFTGEIRPMQVLPEFEVAREQEQAQEAQVLTDNYNDFNMEHDNVISLIDDTIPMISGDTTGPVNVNFMDTPVLGDEDARDLRANLDTIKSKLALSTMTELKKQSSSGATGFGALSEKELAILQDEIAKLDQNLSPRALKHQLEVIRSHYGQLKHKSDRGYKQAGGKIDSNAFNNLTKQVLPEIGKAIQLDGGYKVKRTK